MEVFLVHPHGFCEGVKRALAIAETAKKENPDRLIYVIGLLVHNEEVIASFISKGFLFYDERYMVLEKSLRALPDGTVIVFAAHGHAPLLDEIAKEKKMIIYDASCPFVKDNARLIEEELAKNGEVIYIGETGHAESQASLGINPQKVHLLDVRHPEAFSWLDIGISNPLVVAQTTMDLDDIEKGKTLIEGHFPAAHYAPARCFATRTRQAALTQAPADIDLFVILGSSNSNNTNKLVALAKKTYPEALVVRALNLLELKGYKIAGKKKAALASGASTSDQTFAEVYAYLSQLK
jgi:4-hydroxy-3-methylbut-2-enyl diphosphate reductase